LLDRHRVGYDELLQAVIDVLRSERGRAELFGSERMVIHLPPQLEAALHEQARRRGVAPETLAVDALRERFLREVPAVEPRDEWERRLFDAALDCGVSVPDSALSSDGLYE
jgi:hypothetical protein